MTEKFGALFDFRDMQLEQNKKTQETLEIIQTKIEALQLESSIRRIK